MKLFLPPLDVDRPAFWQDVARCAVLCMAPWAREVIRSALLVGDAPTEAAARAAAELVIRTRLGRPCPSCRDRGCAGWNCCRSHYLLSIVALDLVPAARAAWRRALLAALKEAPCDER